MVTLGQLAALDLLIWLFTNERAARLAGTNPSTISRRSRQVLGAFNLRLFRGPAGWTLQGDPTLLRLQRRVHQLARFGGRAPLRLHLPYWTRRRWLDRLPAGWLLNPPDPDLVCENPITLLRERIIDAALVTPTQIPERVSDLKLVDLYRRPIELTLLAGGSSPSASGEPVLKLLPFLPRSCRERSLEWFKGLTGSDWTRPDGSPAVAFLTLEMREAQSLPWTVDASFEPYPYVERLVVLAENAGRCALNQLQEPLMGAGWLGAVPPWRAPAS
jgi:hypothetical protein